MEDPIDAARSAAWSEKFRSASIAAWLFRSTAVGAIFIYSSDADVAKLSWVFGRIGNDDMPNIHQHRDHNKTLY